MRNDLILRKVKNGFLIIFLLMPMISFTQSVQDDFEGNGTINSWFGDDCVVEINAPNPNPEGINTSDRVLECRDEGGLYANVRFDVGDNFDLSENHTFSLKVYVPSNSVTGNQPNQISLKLQDGTLEAPWSTQTEVIKSIALDTWQSISFNFNSDNYINLDPNSPPPTLRTDLNRVLIQVNGENNNDQVVAYIDDVFYDGTIPVEPVFGNLVWSDEFDTDGAIDSEKWFHQTQLPVSGSWYNGEIQHYTNRIENASVEEGNLSITARKETFTDQGHTKQYTSARLNSKFAFQYGRVEVRAKMPFGVGTWPAIWTLGKNISEQGAYWQIQGFGTTGWPYCGEMDIMEHWGHNQNYISSATHTPSSHGATENVGGQVIPTVSSEFHVYELEWTAEKLVFSVDGVVHFIYNPEVKNAETWPFDAEQYILLNVAMLPNVDPNFTESAMEIDYVRVYQEGSPVSTKEVELVELPTYYPNPVDNEVTIELPESTKDELIFYLYNIDGKLINTINKIAVGNNVTLDGLGYLKTGKYVLNFQINAKQYSLKLIKN